MNVAAHRSAPRPESGCAQSPPPVSPGRTGPGGPCRAAARRRSARAPSTRAANDTGRNEAGFAEHARNLVSRRGFPKSLPSMAFPPGSPRPPLPGARATSLYGPSGRTRHAAGASRFATGSPQAVTPGRPIPTFLDPSGRRWARLRTGALIAGVLSTGLFLVVLTSVLVPPVLPTLPLVQTAADSIGHAPRAARSVPKHPISVRAERERVASRQRLLSYLNDHPAPPALRYAQMPIVRTIAHGPTDPAGAPVTAGFYVNWDDNSLASLRSHIDALDWVVAEWGFVGKGVDTLPIRFSVDRRVLVEAARAKQPVRVFAMVTNFTGNDFDARALTRLLGHPRLVRRAIATIADTLARYGLAGVTLDFENVPRTAHTALLRFLRALKTRLAGDHRLVTQAVPADDLEWPLERYGAIDDYVFLMLYDEHDPSDEPGPISSEPWFEHHLERVLKLVPAAKLIVSLGQYGYEWSDTTASATELTFQDVMQLARDHHVTPAMDRATLNPTFAWDDLDSTSHVVWFLDGVTAYNELRRALPRAVRGVSVWRLGCEDPSLWSVLDHAGVRASPDPLDTIRIGYDVEFIGTGH